MTSTHCGVDDSVHFRSPCLTLNLITKGVEITLEKKLTLKGLAITPQLIIIIACPTWAYYERNTDHHPTHKYPGKTRNGWIGKTIMSICALDVSIADLLIMQARSDKYCQQISAAMEKERKHKDKAVLSQKLLIVLFYMAIPPRRCKEYQTLKFKVWYHL